ncbi:hypothetical protein [Sphingobacterium sp. 40-24]|uniref:hypothetical protein n=1 Tax=Sphingobacterium sp. 40-24 TaxID=1895843 RepID=UPI000959AFFE|nr:hypothetical protein [Sphingobacterium sp. 40-24]OJZ14333.1 MAG: hypothetical protein BGP15_06505 [Sphingobacterium sp. 40-24]
MTEKKLTKAELGILMDFIRSKGYHYVDVQLEILDHFACKVEELMSSDAGMYFNRAIDLAYASFGEAGFGSIAASYELNLQRKQINKFPADFLQFVKHWHSAIYIVYFTLFYYFVPLDADAFWTGLKLGMIGTLVFYIPVYLLRHRPRENKYCVYRNYLGLTIPIMVLIIGLVSSEWIVNYVPLALYRVVILIFMYIGLGILSIFEKNLKAIVRRVDEIEVLHQS